MAKKHTPFPFGELRSLLQQPPSPALWEQLCALVFPTKWEKDADIWLPYTQDMLDRGWPDALRVWPEAWMSNRRSSAAALARALRVELPSKRKQAQLLWAIQTHQPTLRCLSFHDTREEGPPRIAQLLENMPALTELELSEAELRDPALLSLMTASGQLRRLALDRCKLTQAGLDTLLRAAELEELELNLEGNPPGYYTDKTYYSGLGALLGPAAPERMRALRLHSAVDRAEAQALLALPWRRLERLAMVGAGLTDADLAALLATPRMRHLKTLDMAHNRLGAGFGDAMMQAAPPLRLKALRVAPREALPDEAMALALRSRALEQVEELALGILSGGATSATLTALHAPRLRKLQLATRAPDDLITLLERGHWPALQTLELRVRLSDDLLTRLARLELPALRSLTQEESLDSADPEITEAGVEALSSAPWFTQLDTLQLRSWRLPHSLRTLIIQRAQAGGARRALKPSAERSFGTWRWS
jgi:hypothetical protein